MQKQCKRCERLLPLSSFYARTDYVGGHKTECKECYKLRYTNNNKHTREYRRRHPEKMAVHTAIKWKRFRAYPRHHWSYLPEHATDVIVLSAEAHAIVHKHIAYDPKTKMYRCKRSNELLDTKHKHIQHISKIIQNANRITNTTRLNQI